MRSKIKICLLISTILLITSLFAQPSDPEAYRAWKRAYNDSMSRSAHEEGRLSRAMDMYVENDYVRGDLDETSGEYEEGADPTGTASYSQITFSWPDAPGTGYIIYKVDTHDPMKTDDFLGGMPDVDEHYVESDGTAVVEWHDVEGVDIKQTISAHTLGYSRGENEQIQFKTYITCADDECHDVGCLLFFDTDLRTDDAAEISTSFGYTGSAEIFFAPDIPAFWRAYEGGYPPSPTAFQALGILWGYDAVMPDVFWYGSWGSGTGNGWPDSDWITDSGSPFGDSATMVKWYQRRVCPGDTIVYSTYYGIGELLATSLYSSHTPINLESNCDSLWPNPDSAEVLVVNAGTADAEDIEVTFMAPSGINVLSANPLNLGTMVGYGATEFAYFQIEFLPETYGTVQNYSIQITYGDPGIPGERDTVYNEFEVDVPVGPFEIKISSDDSSLCRGDSTRVYLEINEGGSENYSLMWYPTHWFSDPTSRESWVYPENSQDIYVYVQDDISCAKMDTIEITLFEPPSAPVNVSPSDGEIALQFELDQTLIWNAAEGYGDITYTCYYWTSEDGETLIAASGITDTFTTIDTDCSSEIFWYVMASNECGDAIGEPTSFQTIPCGNPEAFVVHPFEGAWSSCANQEIIIYIEDDYEIDQDSYRITVNGTTYESGDSEISSSPIGDTLYFRPGDIFTDGMTVHYTVDYATNIFGVPLEPISSSFYVDLSYPEISSMTPMNYQMVLTNEPDISFTLIDDYSGLDPDLTTITFNGEVTYDMTSSAFTRSGDRFTFSTSDANERFAAGDTIYIEVGCGDSPDYCAPNEGTHTWQFNLEPEIGCFSQPNPFTPNNDNYNDIVMFEYPFMFSEIAELKIYDKYKQLVFEDELEATTSASDYGTRKWTGIDSDGKKVDPGIYIYTISRDKEVICEGTITLVR